MKVLFLKSKWQNAWVEFVACKSQIIREIRKERGSCKKLLRYYEATCLTIGCVNITSRDVYSFYKGSGYCKKCSDLKKINGIDRLKHTTAKASYLALFNSLLKTCKEKNKTISLTFEEFKTFTIDILLKSGLE